MKKWLIISIILNLIILAPIVYLSLSWRGHVQEITKSLAEQHYHRKATMFEAMPVQKNSIIFLGNSIIEGANWAELFENSNIINRGIGGDITAGVINRLDEIVRHKPSKLFISIGTNDIAREIPIREIINNYLTIIQKLRTSSPHTKLYIQSILPVAISSGSVLLHNNKEILEVNQELRRICEDLNIPYLDLHPHFTDETGKLKSDFTNDDLHLLGAGYLLWKDL
ncbi:GDSL-type esterase/lipase family protein, partial [Xanthovirga aplysinae]|uniref:GDSL-type esterase/lipase family protein n=1 Tax=Xanthovirga aplysinae TaxID=2529853 RepID=UPI0012BBD846